MRSAGLTWFPVMAIQFSKYSFISTWGMGLPSVARSRTFELMAMLSEPIAMYVSSG